ncbi:cardiolipin synthase [Aneurinibacillus tyrosinisolvens]|uniref:cardiolipin synthase n=1 Tax=Aneurinibacillus tyrosinisolvens TaxID=1443435 RepID=UPI0009E3AADF|nr:cardiolipin synthase [Aneurinibacillus tyrosinisolvens]
MKRFGQFVLLLAMAWSCYFSLYSTEVWAQRAWVAMYIIILFLVTYSLILEERAPHNTLMWLFVLFFIPVFGYLFYLYSGQLYLKGLLFKRKRSHNINYLREMSENKPSIKWGNLTQAQKQFSDLVQHIGFTSISFASDTTVLKNGRETFSEIKRHLEQAKHFIHMEYYIFRSDKLGKDIINILIKKAQEGIEVRFLYDAIGSLSLSGRDIRSLKKAGVKVFPFLPIMYGFFNLKFNFRNHRKIIVIDGEIGFVGGLNVGDEYLGKNKLIGFWRDTHLMIKGEAVRTLHTVFLLDWGYISGEKLGDRKYHTVKDAEGDGGVQIVAGGPDTRLGLISDLYYSMISGAAKSVWIATPYFVPNEAIRTALKIAAHKGVQVRLMVPQISDSFLTQYATFSYFAELLRSGIEIYTYQKGFMHQKVVIVDGDLASIGTANIDLRSFQLNFEVNVFLFGTRSINDLIRHYEEDMMDSMKVNKDEFNRRGLLARSKESVARLFSPVL